MNKINIDEYNTYMAHGLDACLPIELSIGDKSGLQGLRQSFLVEKLHIRGLSDTRTVQTYIYRA